MEPETVSSRKAIVRACIVVLLLIVCALFAFTLYLFVTPTDVPNLRVRQTVETIYATNTAVENAIRGTNTARAKTLTPSSP